MRMMWGGLILYVIEYVEILYFILLEKSIIV